MQLLIFMALLFLPRSVFAQNTVIRNSRPPLVETTLEGLASWQTANEDFFERTHDPVPMVSNPEDWTIEISGEVEKPMKISLKDLKQKFSKKSLFAVLQCSGNGRGLQEQKAPGIQWMRGAVGNAAWEGVSFSDIVNLVQPKKSARFVTVQGADAPVHPNTPPFVRSIPISKMQDANTLLAFSMNGVEMPVNHGGPLRLVLPGWYGQNWIKWVKTFHFSAEEDQRLFMKKAYRMPKKSLSPGENWDSTTGTPIEKLIVNSFIYSHYDGDVVLKNAPVVIKGKTFSSDAVSKIEYSFDGGKKWNQNGVILAKQNPLGGWQEFSIEFKMPKPVTNISVRATDQSGNVQPLKHSWHPSGYLYHAVQTLTLKSGDFNGPEQRKLVAERCFTCHSQEMVESQKLSAATWEKTLQKMHSFGAQIEPNQIKNIAAYLAK